jgi:hypothetical protein
LGLNTTTAIALDSSGWRQHSTISSDFSSIWQSGTTPEYFWRFDGSNDRIQCGNILDMNATDCILFSMWVRPQAADAAALVFAAKKSTVATGANAGYALGRNTSNQLVFYISDGATQHAPVSAATLLQNVWKHVAVSVNRAGSLQTYVNGVASGTPVVMTTGSAVNALQHTIGANANGAEFSQVDVGGDMFYNFGATMPSDIATIVSNLYAAEKAGYGL